MTHERTSKSVSVVHMSGHYLVTQELPSGECSSHQELREGRQALIVQSEHLYICPIAFKMNHLIIEVCNRLIK